VGVEEGLRKRALFALGAHWEAWGGGGCGGEGSGNGASLSMGAL